MESKCKGRGSKDMLEDDPDCARIGEIKSDLRMLDFAMRSKGFGSQQQGQPLHSTRSEPALRSDFFGYKPKRKESPEPQGPQKILIHIPAVEREESYYSELGRTDSPEVQVCKTIDRIFCPFSRSIGPN